MASNPAHLRDALWRRPSYSEAGSGNCVEAADNVPSLVPVRDSKLPDGPALLLAATAWTSFVAALKSQ
ncbi:DUF397 domain-containing protein [Streptomyces lavendulae]|nr:DUF397 domain-containing protein [Streptomyces lavendulae]TXJ84257.1 DUF397 domain-containing protein [Streptomyces lavendulae]